VACPECKSDNVETLSSTSDVKPGTGQYSPHPTVKLVAIGLKLGEAAVKGMFSRRFVCRNCGHVWRKWSL
jgi:hypothetical protein